MKTCYKCGTDVQIGKCVKEGIALDCLKCPKCGEEYFTSSELIKFDIKSGGRQQGRRLPKETAEVKKVGDTFINKSSPHTEIKEFTKKEELGY